MAFDKTFATGIHIVVVLSYFDKLATSELLAKSVCTNPGLIRRIAAKLHKAEIIKCYAGKNGGMKLSKAPEDITLLEIYEALSLSPALKTSNREVFSQCYISCNISNVLSGVFEEGERALKSTLADKTIADIKNKIEAMR
ncbi:RrF2 family transcriptional regulator [Candidatus Uabimicrobium amorphum]|uniref:Putative HTH-type transcriptional regulatorYwnA n=1 Tax=Uabimicrobium amorphum TaxID=2596890 RepID=A0A5S9INU6_UABAM|nr:Rrf2 family transcriptional regulator [Candidatus Uabimicrobium amorphum]BBM84856.1 putative HTH-type transcriptional regulatorYwnA [Candidatus Uabimicrobium amorphum]